MLFHIGKKKVMVTSQAVNYGGYKKANNATHETPNYLKKKSSKVFSPQTNSSIHFYTCAFKRYLWDCAEMSCGIKKYFFLASALPVEKVAVWVLFYQFSRA